MGKKPLITIGITSYNAEDTIYKAVISALKQNYINKEILIIDDGSKDKTVTKILKLKKKYKFIKFYKNKKNYNYAYSLNLLIKKAKGKFIVFFDDDDISNSKRISRLYNRLITYEKKNNTNKVLIYSNRKVIDKRKEIVHYEKLGIGRKSPEPHGIVVAEYILKVLDKGTNFVWGEFGSCTLMSRLKFLKKINGFDTKFDRCAELDMAIKASFNNAHFISVNKPLITQNITNKPHKTLKKDLKARFMLTNKYKKFLEKRNLYYLSLLNVYAWYWYQRKMNILGNIFRGFYYLLKFKNNFKL